MQLAVVELTHLQLGRNLAAHRVKAHKSRSGLQAAWLPVLILLALLAPFLPFAVAVADDDGVATANAAIVINEIHYDPADKRAHVEYVELFNGSSLLVDLSGWAFTEGIRYEFAPGTMLAPGHYLVVAADPLRLQQRYGIPALGPYTGRLANEGERLVLRDGQAHVVDSVEYGVGFPWPIGGGDSDLAIGLVNATLDNSIPGAWRAGGASPGRNNGAWLDNPPPFIDAVEHLPAAPTAFDALQIRAQVSDADGVASVRLLLQDVAPGNYIRLTDPAYGANWTAVPMQSIGPDLYAADVPAYMRVHRHLIRYRIEATDRGGRTVTAPYWEDPQPNFALYVYNGVPAWSGAISPGAPGANGVWQSHDFNQMRPMAVYQLLAVESDVAAAQHIPDTSQAGYMGNDYPWFGTLVYNGAVYDHIGFRARGGLRRYATGKNNWKFNFRRGHRFQAYDDYGVPYPVEWDKLVFSSVLQHANRHYRGEQGMFEAMSYRLFNLADVPASTTHFVHFRVVDRPTEQTGNQYDSDFWGLYLAIENVDGRFLDQHQLPDGNLYEMKSTTGELDNEGETGVADASDLQAFMNSYLSGAPGTSWWRSNFDLAGYYSYRSISEAIHNYDIWEGKNYYYYLDPQTNRWSMLPWDLDITWAESMSGSGLDPFFTRVLPQPEFQMEYQNRLREIRDLLFTPDQIFPMLDETAALIDTPQGGSSMVDADRALWDYNPILASRYVVLERAKTGQFYRASPTGDFRGMVQKMRNYVLQRITWIDKQLLTDGAIPYTPGLWYGGPGGYPADQLVFDASGFGDPQGAHTFAAIQWRVAELSYPGIPGYDASRRGRYEIEATWTSAELTTYQSRVALPQGSCTPGATCRVRVRMKDQSGRWSHWSAPIQFVAGPPSSPAVQGLVISELMYNPLHANATPSEQLEFIELRNNSAATVDLSGAHFASAIDFTFPSGASLAPGRHLVLAANAAEFANRYDFQPFGEYGQTLKDSGEEIRLVDVFGRTLVDVAYGDSAEWDATADGTGYSLVLKNPAVTDGLSNPATWRASQGVGGSPGADDPEAVVVNEVIFDFAAGRITQVELHNPGAMTAPIGNWLLTLLPAGDDWRWQSPPSGLRIANGAQIPPGGYLVISISPEQLVLDDNGQWTMSLFSLADGRLSGYRSVISLQAPAFTVAAGRTTNSRGVALFAPLQMATPGAPNADVRVGPVVISQMRVVPGDSTQWIELTNLSNQAVPLFVPEHPEQTWMIAGALFRLPSGITVPPRGKVLIAGNSPTALCASGQVDAGVRVTGPFAMPLRESGMRLTLLRPVTWRGGWIYAAADMVEQGEGWPLPGELYPILQRNPLEGFGPDAAHWQVVAPAEPTGNSAETGQPCLFEVITSDDGANVVRWMVTHDPAVRQYILSSSDFGRNIPNIATIPVDPSAVPGQLTEFTWEDSTVASGTERYYWLAAEYEDGHLQELGFTNPLTVYRMVRLPLVSR